MNKLDKDTIDTTRNLINLLNTQAEENGDPTVDASNFTGEEIQQLASTLVRKVWSRRSGILKTGNRLATKLLQLTADKLETGERDALVLPSADLALDQEEMNDGRIHEESAPKEHSQRLLNARRILEEAEMEESMN
jgi:hypothetical protein